MTFNFFINFNEYFRFGFFFNSGYYLDITVQKFEVSKNYNFFFKYVYI